MAGDFNRIELVVAPDIIIISCVAGKRWRSTVFFWSSHLFRYLSLSLSFPIRVHVSVGRCARQCAKEETSFEVVIIFVRVCVLCHYVVADRWWNDVWLRFGFFFFPFTISYHFSSARSFLSRVSTLSMILYFIFCSLYQRLLAVRAALWIFRFGHCFRRLVRCIRTFVDRMYLQGCDDILDGVRKAMRVFITLMLPPEILMWKKDKMNSKFGFWLMCCGILRRPTNFGENLIQAHCAFGYTNEPTIYRKGT